jgi:CDP-diacylglycerol--glycerol-3-phosphate 3-phosphatidyltransferase
MYNLFMSEPDALMHPKALSSLRREWLIYLAASLAFVLGGYLLLASAWEPRYALRWLVVTLGLVAYQFGYLYRHLLDNRLKDGADTAVFPNLGLANGLTTARSVLTAALAGFLTVPWPGGWLAWAPGLLYLTSAVMDYLDGYVARITGRTTVLGEDLDMRWDGTGMLFGATLSVLYGQTPLPYLLVGLARYAFLFGLWVRERRGQPVYDLPPSRFRRALAGMQMGFVAVVLLPVYGPPVTQIAAVFFMLPLLIGFARDYLWVTGRLMPPEQDKTARLAQFHQRLTIFLPLALRALLAALLVNLIVYLLHQAPLAWTMIVLAGLAALSVVIGAAGRVFALLVVLMAGFSLRAAPLEWRYWFILVCSILLFMSGTGRYSLWKPEDWLIYRRAGDRAAQQQA